MDHADPNGTRSTGMDTQRLAPEYQPTTLAHTGKPSGPPEGNPRAAAGVHPAASISPPCVSFVAAGRAFVRSRHEEEGPMMTAVQRAKAGEAPTIPAEGPGVTSGADLLLTPGAASAVPGGLIRGEV